MPGQGKQWGRKKQWSQPKMDRWEPVVLEDDYKQGKLLPAPKKQPVRRLRRKNGAMVFSHRAQLKKNGTIYTVPLARKLISYILRGNYISTACKMAGISDTAFNRWLKKGRDEPERYPHFAAFAIEVDRAVGFREDRRVRMVEEHSRTNWCASAWLLERSEPDRWGRKDYTKHDITQKVSIVQLIQQSIDEKKPKTIDAKVVSDEKALPAPSGGE